MGSVSSKNQAAKSSRKDPKFKTGSKGTQSYTHKKKLVKRNICD